jgi:hypothetical protein
VCDLQNINHKNINQLISIFDYNLETTARLADELSIGGFLSLIKLLFVIHDQSVLLIKGL